LLPPAEAGGKVQGGGEDAPLPMSPSPERGQLLLSPSTVPCSAAGCRGVCRVAPERSQDLEAAVSPARAHETLGDGKPRFCSWQLVDIHRLTWLTQQRTCNLLGDAWIQAFKQLKKKKKWLELLGCPSLGIWEAEAACRFWTQ